MKWHTRHKIEKLVVYLTDEVEGHARNLRCTTSVGEEDAARRQAYSEKLIAAAEALAAILAGLGSCGALEEPKS